MTKEKNKIISLDHTKWIFEIGKNCIKYFEFINDTAQYYNCELGYFDKDPYKIENDTITIYEYVFKSEMDTTEVYVGRLKMIVYKNNLIPGYLIRRTETGKDISYVHQNLIT